MKRLFSLAVVLIIGLAAFSQSKLYIRGDTVNIRREGGNSTTIIDSIALIRKALIIGAPTSAITTYKNNSHLVIGDSATTKGLIIPRVQSTAAITDPKQGMVVYSISDSSFYFRRLSDWVKTGTGEGTGAAIFPTITALKAGAINTSGAVVLGVGNTVQGEYEYDIESSTSGDDYLVIDPSPSGTGRYLKIFKGGKVRALELKILSDGTNQKAQIDIAAALSTVQEITFDESNTTTAINGKVTLPANKAIRFEGNALLGGNGGSNDTLDLNGGVIIADFQKQIFATNLVVIGAGNRQIPVNWFGAVADYVSAGVPASPTDNLIPFTRALLASIQHTDTYFNYAPEIIIPGNDAGFRYYFSAPWVINAMVNIRGSGQETTFLQFPATALDTAAIFLRYPDIGGATYKGGRNMVLREFTLIASQNGTSFYDSSSHGIYAETGFTAERLTIQGFNGNGIHIKATGPASNANNYNINYCTEINNSGSGIYAIGADVNAGAVIHNNGYANGIAGISDWGFLGSNILFPHSSGNGYENYWNHSQVSHGGVWYRAIYTPGQGTNLNIEPGVHASTLLYWEAWNTGGQYCPTGTPISGGGCFVPNWSSTQTYVVGGSMVLQGGGGNQFGLTLGGYSEGDQYVGYSEGNNLTVGGNQHAFYGTSIGSALGSVVIKRGLNVKNLWADTAYHEIAGLHTGYADGALRFGLKYSASTKKINIEQTGVPGETHFLSSLYSSGRSVTPIGSILFDRGALYFDDTNKCFLGLRGSIPTTGAHEIGDVYVYNGSDGSILYYRCSVAGTPGTWTTKSLSSAVSMGAIGGTPNANGASISSGVLTLQPADATYGGVVIAGAQTFGGAKTFQFTGASDYIALSTGLIEVRQLGNPVFFLGYKPVNNGYGFSATYFYASAKTWLQGGYDGAYYPIALQNLGGLVGIGNDAPDTKLHVTGDLKVTTIANATSDLDKFLVSDGGIIKHRTGAEVLSDIGAVTTARTLTINGTTQDLSANRTFTVDGVFTTTTFATTNATPANVITYGTATNERGVIEVTLTGVKSNGDGITGKKIVAYKNIAGTVTLGTITEDLATVADGDLSTAVWTVSVSGTNVIVVFTGVAATVIDGTTSHKITKIIPAS